MTEAIAQIAIFVLVIVPIVILLWGAAILVVSELVKEYRGKKP